MEKFTQLHGVALKLGLTDVDTDMIIPARFMKALTRTGLGDHLFQELRFSSDGVETADFILNHPSCRDARILVAGRNFGCGSSREHAVWALVGFGIRCVIAPSFGDIFSGNARKNGLLLIRLPDALCDRLFGQIVHAQYAPMTIDLVEQQIMLVSGEVIGFTVDRGDRNILLEGLDDIDRTLRHADAIAQFEATA